RETQGVVGDRPVDPEGIGEDVSEYWSPLDPPVGEANVTTGAPGVRGEVEGVSVRDDPDLTQVSDRYDRHLGLRSNSRSTPPDDDRDVGLHVVVGLIAA